MIRNVQKELSRLVGGLLRWGRRVAFSLARLREREHVFLVVMAVLLGLLGGYGAIVFRTLIAMSTALFSLDAEWIAGFSQVPWLPVLLLPALGGLIVGIIIVRITGEVQGSGIPEVMEAVAEKGAVIGGKVVIFKALAAAVTIGSGGSAGREGPIVHIGAAIGSVVGQVFQVPVRHLRTFVACGTSAAIAATFNAPIAGALFAMEVVLGEIGVARMSPIVISSVVATVVSRHYLGDFPAFDVPGFTLVSSRELVLYAGLGILAGFLAIAFINMLYFCSERFSLLRIPLWLKPGVGGGLVGVMALVVPDVLGVGYETINESLQDVGQADGWARCAAGLLLIMVAKIVATSFTLGSGGSGGVFAPSLFVGATMGAAFGTLAGEAFPDWTGPSSAYALVGMGAMVSATTHAPIAAILIIFELTNNYTIIPPLMLACVVGVLLSSYLKKDSIYTEKLTRRGVSLRAGRDVNLLRGISVNEVYRKDCQLVPSSMPVRRLFSMLLEGRSPNAVVVSDAGTYVGTVELRNVRELLRDSEELALVAVAADVADRTTPFVVPEDALDVVMHLFGQSNRDDVPVCDNRDNRRVLGVVSRTEVINVYNARLFSEDAQHSMDTYVQMARDGQPVFLASGISIANVDVPCRWFGRRLGDLRIGTTTAVHIVLVLRPGETEQALFPTADFVFEKGDRALVLGDPDRISRL